MTEVTFIFPDKSRRTVSITEREWQDFLDGELNFWGDNGIIWIKRKGAKGISRTL